jgi:crotonobetainyl-CoA:carnitine CoA-transferase CaiB-like acyl-CoA transferase
MVDAALSITAEQVIEHSAYGALLSRSGNRGPCAAPQNLYRAAAEDKFDDTWVAIAVATDDHWHALCDAIDATDLAADPSLATADGRVAAHDRIDQTLQEWCRARTAEQIVDRLWDAGVPVGKVMQPHHQPDLAQLAHRTFFEEMEHPVAPPSRYSTLPMRFSNGPDRLHTRPAPLLGEHNAELLRELGLSDAAIDALEADGIIGRSLTAVGGGR